MTLSEVSYNPLTFFIVSFFKEIMSKNLVNEKIDLSKLSPLERKINDLSRLSFALNESLDCIENSYLFMQHFHDMKTVCDGNGINEVNFINYHVDVFIHKVSTIHDLIFKLTNALYDLGLSDRKCDWNHILKKKEIISNSSFFHFAQTYYDFLSKLIKLRNESTHKGVLNNPYMKEVDPILAAIKGYEKYGGKVSTEEYLYVNAELFKAKKKLFEDFNIHKENIYTIIHCLLCSYFDIILSWITPELKSKYPDSYKQFFELIVKYGCKCCKS